MSLRDEVRILKELPPRLKRRVELGVTHTMAPISWSDISYYHDQVCRLLLKWYFFIVVNSRILLQCNDDHFLNADSSVNSEV